MARVEGFPAVKILFMSTALTFLPCVAAAEYEVEGLGRLFIDPVQREKLEAVRRGTYKAETEQESRVSNVRVNGIMIRSDGDNVVWINGESTLGGISSEGIRVNPDATDARSYRVPVRIDGKVVGIKPGQNWSEGTGTVKDNY